MKTALIVLATIVVLLGAGGGWIAHKGSMASSYLGAAFNGNIVLVQHLLNEGEPVDTRDPKYGATALIYAAQEGHTDIVKLMLDRGADINAKSKIDQTALMQAAYYKRYDTVKLLLQRGAKLDDKHRDDVLLAVSDDAEIVKMLNDQQAKPQGKAQ